MKARIPVEQGKCYEMEIASLGTSGEGIGRVEGFTVFVRGALPKECVRVRIEAVRKSYAAARLEAVLRESPDRARPRCAIYEACGGCQLQHMKYEAQLAAKRQQVADALVHIGGFPKGIEVLPVACAPDPWNYRNKMQFPVGHARGGLAIGCYARGTHDIIDTEDCCIQRTQNNEIANAMRKILAELSLPAYDEDRHTGLVRHIVGRVGKDGRAMLVLVTARKELPRERALVQRIRARLPFVASIHQNIQTYRNNVILGRETRLLWGAPAIEDAIGRLAFAISPRSFFQVNTQGARLLYETALDFAALTGRETVLDAYCGTGTITLFLAQRARKAYGIEIVRPAIEDARKNARANHIKNAEFLVGDATAWMPRLAREGIRPEVITVDPPRAGCSEQVLAAISRMAPARIVYISCNPATLARDMKSLASKGYTPNRIQPVDMFPQTSHVEVCLELVRSDLLEKEKAKKAKKTEK